MRFLVQDGDKIKKATIDGLEEVGEGKPSKDDFEEYGTEDLADIIGYFDKGVEMKKDADLDEGSLYSCKIVGFRDISALAVGYEKEEDTDD